ncbi:MAG TPA: hypothetical protein VH083_13275 [Myxococcales bacterium]|nr:hypothetical protein [Myxococcales bacterium]
MKKKNEIESRKTTEAALRKAAASHREAAKSLQRASHDVEEAARATACEAKALAPHDRPYKAEIVKVRKSEARNLAAEAKVMARVAQRLEHQADAEKDHEK